MTCTYDIVRLEYYSIHALSQALWTPKLYRNSCLTLSIKWEEYLAIVDTMVRKTKVYIFQCVSG